MNAGWRRVWTGMGGAIAVAIGLSLVFWAGPGRSEACFLSSRHAGVTFSVDRVDRGWACRLQSIIENYTTISSVGPIRAAMSASMYQYLLDRPPLAAALINRLELGLYRSEVRGPGRYWGDDGEGTRGHVQLVSEDRSSRVYYLEGVHDSRLLPTITGKAVVFLKMTPVADTGGMEAMDSTIVSYIKLDNRILSGAVSLLRPLVGGIVTRKLKKGAETVDRLGQMMRQHPDRVLLQAMGPPPFPDEDVAFLKDALVAPRRPADSSQRNTRIP
jgi:hypothetical protein